MPGSGAMAAPGDVARLVTSHRGDDIALWVMHVTRCLLAVRLQELARRGTIEGMATLKVGSLGEYIRDQRRTAQYSLRQLADAAGVSNPYLSQIERGLRRPSAEVLQQIAKALRISAEALYVQAGILEERDGGEEVTAVLLADPELNERQKRVLLDIYESFRKENAANAVR